MEVWTEICRLHRSERMPIATIAWVSGILCYRVRAPIASEAPGEVRPISSQPSSDWRPPDPRLPRRLSLRKALRDQLLDRCPILHRDHRPVGVIWPRFQPSQLVFNRC